MKEIIIPDSWRGLAEKIESHSGRSIVMIIGGVDSGKSTLCSFLYDYLIQRSKLVCVIDADLGQSTIGPPCTVGLSLNKDSDGAFHPFRIRFVGAVSPRSCMLQTVVAIKKLFDKSMDLGARHVIIDTSGYVSGVLGREYKFQKIDLINPTHIVVLERGEELKTLVRNLFNKGGAFISRIKVPDDIVCSRNPEERKTYREARFQEYFKGSYFRSLPLKRVGLFGFVPDLMKKDEWLNLLIGLNDYNNNTLSLGIVKNIELSERIISFQTPLDDPNRVKIIRFGSISIENGVVTRTCPSE